MILISDEEYSSVKEQFDKVISYNTGIESPQTDEIFDQWYKAKAPFITTFGGLIWESEKEFSVSLSENIQQSYYEQVLDKLIHMNGQGWIYDYDECLSWFQNCVQADGFIDNYTKRAFYIKAMNITIPAGAKVLKEFKYFITDSWTLRYFQDFCSQFQQQKGLSGRFCLSVHPLDFLSLSNNNCNWRTCHSLDGEFRAGNIAYMLDECTFICYLKTREGLIPIDGFPSDVPWNNKKWRILVFLSSDFGMILTGCQYPVRIGEAGLKQLREEFLKCGLIDNSEYLDWTDWTDENYSAPMAKCNYITANFYPKGYLHMEPLSAFVGKGTDQCFVDMLDGMLKKPLWMARRDSKLRFLDNENSKFVIGKKFKCLKCGKEIAPYGESFLCKKCLDLPWAEDETSGEGARS